MCCSGYGCKHSLHLQHEVQTIPVLAFNRSADGQIVFAGMAATGGTGTGKGLGKQGALAIDAANQFLFAGTPAMTTSRSSGFGRLVRMVFVLSIASLPEASNRSASQSAVRFCMSSTTEQL